MNNVLYILSERNSDFGGLAERPLISYKEDCDGLYFIGYRILYNEYMNNSKLLCKENYERAFNYLYNNEAFLNQATEEEFNQVMKQSLKFLYGVGDN